MRRLAPFLKLVVVLALFATSLRVLQETLAHYRVRDVLVFLSQLPREQVILATVLTLAGYLVMTGYDTLAFRYIEHPLPYAKIALASFIGYAFNNSVGLSGLAGGSVRYRLYNAWRLTAVEIARVIAFCTVSFWLGFAILGGVVFLIAPPDVPEVMHLELLSVRALGVVLLLPAVIYLIWIAVRREPLRIRQWEFELPSMRLFLAQATLSCIDWAIAAGVLYILLPDSMPLTYLHFVGIFLMALVIGVASNVPGGLGVFEAIILIFLSPFFSAGQIFGSLVAFRVIYYLVPLMLATLLLAAHEIIEKREGVVKAWRIFGRWAPGLAPQMLALFTFVGGAVLLFSGATPMLADRRNWLHRLFVPLPIVEISHFLSSLAGAALLILSRGLQRRLDAAYQITVGVLMAGIVFQLFKGADYEEAGILGVMLFALLASRRHFYRKGLLVNESFGPGWMLAILLVLISSAWLGFFSFKHVEYSTDLWWRFQFRGDAPRFLRASVGVVGALLIFAIRHLLRPAVPEPNPPTPEQIDLAATIVKRDLHPHANLALTGDKTLIFNETNTAFLMYGVEGRSWISMGDPVGDDAEKQELIWRFRELCDMHSGWTVFYEVQRRNLHLYLELGLTLMKIGEEARIGLQEFALEDTSRKWMRRTQRYVENQGGSFEIVPPECVPAILPELRAISDSWLNEKKTREKGFSLGSFSEDYMRRFPIALVRKEGRIEAFANIWQSGANEEISLDLMRQAEKPTNGCMDYMFINVILWGKAQGYRWFNIGMAPLAGLENRHLGPLWQRLGAITYRFGENFYNFQGLRQYKDKYDPIWEPTYLASPGGLALPRILTNLAALISGGLRGVVTK